MNPSEIIPRLIITIALVGLALVAYRLWTISNLSVNSKKVHKLQGYQPGKAGIILFSSPTCAPCKTYQKPIIERIYSRMGSVMQFLEIDATLQPELANEWGVVSIPTTYIIEPSGRSRFVHFGLVNEKTLLEQLKELL